VRGGDSCSVLSIVWRAALQLLSSHALRLEQKEQLKKATGKEVSAIELRLETLEDRLTPGTFYN
jgi:hypothetical protein